MEGCSRSGSSCILALMPACKTELEQLQLYSIMLH